MPPKTQQTKQQPKPQPTATDELNDELPPELQPTPQEAPPAPPQEVPAQPEPITGPTPDEAEPLTEAQSLARLLCQADGDDPENFRNGKPRWEHYLYHARQHIAAFEFLCGARGVEGIDL